MAGSPVHQHSQWHLSGATSLYLFYRLFMVAKQKYNLEEDQKTMVKYIFISEQMDDTVSMGKSVVFNGHIVIFY